MTRCFIAVNISEAVKDNIAAATEIIREQTRNVRWARRENWHITLKFLGELRKGQIQTVGEVLEEICASVNTFEMELKGSGSFPEAKDPKIVWIGLGEGSEILQSLSIQIEQALAQRGFAREQRDYHPHLTLGRVNAGKKPSPYFVSSWQELEQAHFGRTKVQEIELFKSELTPQGSIYSSLGRVALRE